MDISLLFSLFSFFSILSCDSGSQGNPVQEPFNKQQLELSIAIPPGGNSWVINDLDENRGIISKEGIHDWTSKNTIIRTYFKTGTKGTINVGLEMKVPSGEATIKVTVGGKTKQVTIKNKAYEVVNVGTFDIDSIGYNHIDIQGVEKSADHFGEIVKIWIGGPATQGDITYVKDDFYWGRRGPSVHLNYQVPQNTEVQWFYNEITVPKGEDVVGSYFMANGFGEGYFGMQVNSETERRVLFSVWSPYKTQNPQDIPDDYKILLQGKGEGVTAEEFGNEGSGGQSYKVVHWKAGNTYKFLLKGAPSVNNSTDYTAYFYAPEEGEWKLIASFRRPHTQTYLTHLYSFLENFRTEAGVISRKGYFTNQWICNAKGQWQELTHAKFTADATARKGARLDYAGGVAGNRFFLKNCGFFNNTTKIDSFFERQANGSAPKIDFLKLPSVTKP